MNFKSGHHQHAHPGDPDAELKASTRAFVKQSALKCPFASSGEIVKKALSNCENSDVPLPNINTSQMHQSYQGRTTSKTP